jgi:DNA-binding NtrC family response regulator
MLSGRSWIVEAVSNPLDAVQRIQDFQFDVIVTDIHMPQMSGTDLMDHAKSMQPHLKVVLISGQKPSESITADAFAFLAKPFKSAHLVSVVERALSERTHARHESSPPR